MNTDRQHCLTLSTGEDIYFFKLIADNGTEVNICNYGAMITSFHVKNINIVLGFDDVKEYFSKSYLAAYPYFGAEIGRYANRIGDARFTMDGKTYNLSKNHGAHQLHGGFHGFHEKAWELVSLVDQPFPALILQCKSKDGEEGFPGNLLVQLKFELTNSELSMTATATTDQPTPVNLTHHGYFNLNGEGQISNHWVKIHAREYLEQDKNLVPTGTVLPVKNTPYDFTQGKKVNEDWDSAIGYDQTFVVTKQPGQLALSAECRGDKTNLHLQVFSTEPAVHFYTANGLPQIEKNGEMAFGSCAGLCFETQVQPNAVNIPHFPDTILRPGEKYYSHTIYKILP